MSWTIIAVVEDDDGVREALTLLQQREGWFVDAYASGKIFRATFDASEAPACLLLDLLLPGMKEPKSSLALGSLNVRT